MDGDAVEAEPSHNQSEPSSLAEIFTDAFPYYLAMGMSYEEFWRGSPSLVRAYRKAFEIKRANRNWEMWQQGLYIFTALHCNPIPVGFPKEDSKNSGYPDRPLPLSEKEAKEQEQQRELDNTKRFIAQLEAESKRNLEKAKKEAVKDG